MKAQELRIGNYYMFADNEGIAYRRVREIKTNQFGLTGDYDGVNFEICKPIPLTEEWLLKFGFEKVKGGVSFDKGKLSIYLGDTILSGKNGRTYFNSWAIIEESPRYVHQLQNLYFALANEELTLKA